jgi:hypothetical protein
MADINVKAGDTLLANCVYVDAEGQPVNLDELSLTVESAVLGPDGLQRYDLTVTVHDQAVTPGAYTVEGSTAGWPAGRYSWDIRYSTGGRSFSTRTVKLNILEPVT